MRNKIINKKAQIAIWVILAILLVFVILSIFLVRKKPGIDSVLEAEPNVYIEKCARDYVNEAVDLMLPQGGFVEPKDYKVYENMKIAYLCKNSKNIYGCINQHPALLDEITKEIENYISPKIEMCFSQLKEEIEKRRGKLELGEINLSVDLSLSRVIVKIDRVIIMTKAEKTSKYENFNTEMNSPIYDLTNVAIEISNSENKYCYFEYVGYMITHSRFSIEKWMMGDNTKIYTIEDRESKKKMNIAITSKNCRGGATI